MLGRCLFCIAEPSFVLLSLNMASKEGAQAFAPVLAAVATMQGNVPRSEKAQAHEFLEKFQKSVRICRQLALIC